MFYKFPHSLNFWRFPSVKSLLSIWSVKHHDTRMICLNHHVPNVAVNVCLPITKEWIHELNYVDSPTTTQLSCIPISYVRAYDLPSIHTKLSIYSNNSRKCLHLFIKKEIKYISNYKLVEEEPTRVNLMMSDLVNKLLFIILKFYLFLSVVY